MKTKLLNKNIFLYILSFIIPVLIMTIAYADNDIYPGGKLTCLAFDLWEQFFSFFASLRHLFDGFNSPAFNFSTLLGSSYVGTYAYYVASPLSWIVLFFDLKNLPDAIYYIELIKTGLSGLTFYFFICNYKNGSYKIPALFISFCYALSAYSVTYALAPMWMDGVYLLPLCMHFLQKLIKENKKTGFIISVTCAVYFNFYTAYMIVLFSFLFLLYLINEKRDNIKKIILNYIFSGLIIGIVSFPLLYQLFFQLLSGKTGGTLFESDYPFFLTSPMTLFSKFLSTSFTLPDKDNTPMLFLGTITLVIALYRLIYPLIFPQKYSSFHKRQTIKALLLALFLLLSLIIDPLSMVWHMLSEPFGFPGRFSFIFIFFMLTLSYEGLFILPRFYFKKASLLTIIYIFVLTELYLNCSTTFSNINIAYHYKPRAVYEKSIKKTDELLQPLKSELKEDNFYRIVNFNKTTMNDPLLFNYPGLTFFSSVNNSEMASFMGKLGCVYYVCISDNLGMTPLTNMLFNVKYTISKDNAVSINPYMLPIGYAVKSQTIELSDNQFDNQNNLLKAISGIKTDAFIKAPYTVQSVSYGQVSPKEDLFGTFNTTNIIETCDINMTARPSVSGPAFINCDFEGNDPVTIMYYSSSLAPKIYADNIYQGSYKLDSLPYNLFIGNYQKNSIIDIKINKIHPFNNYYIYTLDENTLSEAYNIILNNSLKNIHIKNGAITAQSDFSDKRTVMITIPYDRFVSVKVDGKKTKTHKIYSTFLGFDIEEGMHQIEISYSIF